MTPDPADRTTCASWLDWYANFHRAARGRPNARYLVYTCRPLMPTPGGRIDDPRPTLRPFHCLGIGDRFRLICLLLRVAAAYRRVLLIDWQSPSPIERFFVPERIDWVPTTVERELLTTLPVRRWSSDAIDEEPPRERFVRVVGNAQWFADIRVPGLNFTAVPEPSISCLWRFVFAPSPFLRSAMSTARRAMFGSETAPYNAVHIRMGDAADGVAFDTRSVPQKDRRFVHDAALHMIRCAKAQSPLPVFIATDNAALKRALRGRDLTPLMRAAAAAGGGSAVAAAGGMAALLDGVATQGCVDCMVNPVWLHNFSDASVVDIYVEMGLLAGGECLFHTLSNFAGIAEAWRGSHKCSVHHKVRRSGLGRCNLNLPTPPAAQGADEVFGATCTVSEPSPPLPTYELVVLLSTSAGRHAHARHVLAAAEGALGRSSSSGSDDHEAMAPPHLVVSNWEDTDRTGLIGMRWGAAGAKRSLAGALCVGGALGTRAQWLLALDDDSTASAGELRLAVRVHLHAASHLQPWLFALSAEPSPPTAPPGSADVGGGRGCSLAAGAAAHEPCEGPPTRIDDGAVNMGLAWGPGGEATTALLLSARALHMLRHGPDNSPSSAATFSSEAAAAGVVPQTADRARARRIPPLPLRSPAVSLKLLGGHGHGCVASLTCPWSPKPCAELPKPWHSGKKGLCGLPAQRASGADDCRGCGRHPAGQIGCCLGLAGVYATAVPRGRAESSG